MERYNHEPGGVGFLLAFIALEILANTYAERHRISKILPRNEFRAVGEVFVGTLSQIEGMELTTEQIKLIKQKVPELNRRSIRNKIKRLTDAYGWDFLINKLIDDCIKVRNYMMHLGSYGRFDRTMMPNLYHRIASSVQLALIDLLGCSDCVHDLEDLKLQLKGEVQ
ncbi:hypothetical protein ACFLVF_02040 [Chloroflexota bacterium]